MIEGVPHQALVALEAPAGSPPASASSPPASASSPPASASSPPASASSPPASSSSVPAASVLPQSLSSALTSSSASSSSLEAAAAAASAPSLLAEKQLSQGAGASVLPAPLDAAAAKAEAASSLLPQLTVWSLLVSPLAAIPAFIAARVLWLMKVLAVLSAIFMLLAPLPTIMRVKACRNTADLHSLPYVMLLLSAVIWLVYGLLKRDLVLLVPNACGLFVSAWYVKTFRKYCKHEQQGKLLNVYIALSSLLLAGIFVAALCLGPEKATQLVGLAAAVINVFSYAAPLSALRVILREKSTACLPVEVSMGNWICSSLWLFYGWLSEDLFILLPNLIGTLVGSVQLALLILYPPPSRRGFSVLGGSTCSRPYRPPSCAVPPIEEDVSALAASSLTPFSKGAHGEFLSSASLRSASTVTSEADARGGGEAAAQGAAEAVAPSVCGINAPSLPTHEMLLSDWRSGFISTGEEGAEEDLDRFLDVDSRGNPFAQWGARAALDAAGPRDHARRGFSAFFGPGAEKWSSEGERTSAANLLVSGTYDDSVTGVDVA
ncbi:MtN3/saliva family protein [Besnoitia besnoiti]|uniref:Sugar transporter SWEET1 n=1 Tax=Besnoitia besnoiti TaxID=94643 RepID=A0A2A9MPC8_BESBE|nr:MtN3/saliva family protein [Besnoitia besnoiti]PFH37642.1 MtN3/saliva family protein [Besnoitia besnoiti]